MVKFSIVREPSAKKTDSNQVKQSFRKFNLPDEVIPLLEGCPRLTLYNSIPEILADACGTEGKNFFEVAYDIPGRGRVVEATVARMRNGISVNYPDPYMRRREPDCMVIADQLATDKPLFQAKFGYAFETLRQATYDWLKSQPLGLFAFRAGQGEMGIESVAIFPMNAAFFAGALALLQGITPIEKISADFFPRAILFLAPPFRHTHFQGKQIVVHHRRQSIHELFAYNLYPGPSAKKGIYGVLINQGEREGWVTAHCSTVQVVTPYDNITTIMHEGASGGGKSEMLEQAHREADGRFLLGENLKTAEKYHLSIPRTCQLRAVTDDMALCHPSQQTTIGKLTVQDAENAWFLRINHIDYYGKDVYLERLTAQPPEPLIFLNIDTVPGSRALIWEHIEDGPGKPCSNPRVIVPRHLFPDVVSEPVSVDIRSFGVRTPSCTKENPSYGILGLFHILPPALAWLWRLVSPRGYSNPSIVDSEGMASEGVGSFWPFATGKKVTQANLLFNQFKNNHLTRYILTPNQHVGAWKVGFMPQWIAREYLARHGSAQFKPQQIKSSRCPLLGYTLVQLQVEGQIVAPWFLQVELQPEVGLAGYDQGAESLNKFFKKCLLEFYVTDLHPLGRQIIRCCLDGGSVEDFEHFIPIA